MKTSIIFSRYNNDYSYLTKYPPSALHEYILVDDGSKDTPRLPPYWKIYKITKDIGWNNEGAKNLGVHVAEGTWVLTCEMDLPPFPDVVMRLDTITNILPANAVYIPMTQDGKARNCHLCTKKLWEEVGGYDETFTGRYGYDFTFNMACRDNGYAVLDIPAVVLASNPSSVSMNRPSKNKMFIGREEIDATEKTSERLRFPWERVQ